MEIHDDLEPLNEALEDAHHFLHACERGYHNPSAFRRNLGTFIQVARNVTFRLQSLKARIPNFDDWYPGWQDYLKADPVMSWVNSARTQVVKRKGLAATSTAKYAIIYSYGQPVAETVDVAADTPTAEILLQAIGRVPFNIRERALVVIEREWIAEDLPGQELLSVLAKCVTVLMAVTEEANTRASGGENALPEDAVKNLDPPLCFDRLDRARTIRIHPGTGEIYTVGEEPVRPLSDEQGMQQMQKYRWPEDSTRKYGSTDPLEKAEGLAELSVLTLKADGYHTSFAQIRTPGGRWWPVVFAPEDQLYRYVLWHQIATLVREQRADALMFVGEFWAAPLERLLESGVTDIEEFRGTQEHLVVFVETLDGTRRSWVTPFQHRLRRISVGDQQVDDSYRPPMLEPVRDVWRSGFADAPRQRRVLVGARPVENRLIDRARAVGLNVPEGVERDPQVALGLLNLVVPFVVDEIALYLSAAEADALQALGSLGSMQLSAFPPDFFRRQLNPSCR